MPRKGHKKSRAGCTECKKRRVKCDETQPTCRKCAFSARSCIYLPVAQPSQSSLSLTPRSVLEYDTPSHGHEGAQSPVLSETPTTAIQPFLSLELFYNFEHETCRTIARTADHVDVYRRTIINRAFALPYLMYAILGLSAIHLASQNQEQAIKYKDLAADMQARALEAFDAAHMQDINDSNVLDLLLFQHTIGLHVFCDIFNSLQDNFSDFMNRLVGCIRLLKGIQAVIQPWWSHLSQTELGIIMETSDSHHRTPHESLGECTNLLDMIGRADLSAASIEVCREAIMKLQSYFDSENQLEPEAKRSTNMLFAWLVTASNEYVELLDHRRPEALVILAHYAVLLHNRQQSWAVRNSGQKLFQQVQRYLGRKWDKVLAWPSTVILHEI